MPHSATATCKPLQQKQQKVQHRPRAEALKKNRTTVGWLRAAYNIFVSDLVTLNQSTRLDGWGIMSTCILLGRLLCANAQKKWEKL